VARALREQIDWAALRAEATDSPFMAAFLLLADRLDVAPAPEPREG
jgi:hypothetical protein